MARFQWPDDETRIRQIVLDDLGAGMRQMFAQISAVDGGWALLRFLDQNPKTLMTLEDIAFQVGQSRSTTEKAERVMMELSLMRSVGAAGLTLFGMTEDPDKRRLVHALCSWQDHWHARLAGIERVINGETILSSAP